MVRIDAAAICHSVKCNERKANLLLRRKNYRKNYRYVYFLLDPETQVATEKNRKLGRLVIRGTQVSLISPRDGVEEIANPFLPADDDDPIQVGDA